IFHRIPGARAAASPLTARLAVTTRWLLSMRSRVSCADAWERASHPATPAEMPHIPRSPTRTSVPALSARQRSAGMLARKTASIRADRHILASQTKSTWCVTLTYPPSLEGGERFRTRDSARQSDVGGSNSRREAPGFAATAPTALKHEARGHGAAAGLSQHAEERLGADTHLRAPRRRYRLHVLSVRGAAVPLAGRCAGAARTRGQSRRARSGRQLRQQPGADVHAARRLPRGPGTRHRRAGPRDDPEPARQDHRR